MDSALIILLGVGSATGGAAVLNNHFDLVGIRERTSSLAGKVSLNSRPGQGTDIIVSLPA